MIIENKTFRLEDEIDEATFLEADHRLQAELSSRDGFVRRTTGRGKDGTWLVVTLWGSEENADAPGVLQEFEAMLEEVRVERYESLD